MIKRSIIVIFLFLLFSCYSKKENDLIASVNEKNLFLSDVMDEMPSHIGDSAYFVEKFRDNWIRKELMIYYAEMNLTEDLLKYDKQIENYRASLLTHAYQQELLNQNFDTVILSSEIENYYEKHKEKFKLSKNILQGRFIVIEKSAPNLNLLEKWYTSEKETVVDDLEDYCQQFAKEYYLEYNKWQYFSVFNDKLPDRIKKEEYFLKNTKGVFFEDESFRYYLFVKDYQIRGSTSPLAIEKERIKDLLSNKRKIEYLQKLEDKLYQNGLAKKKIKIY